MNVRVRNLNHLPYTEKFRERLITIGAGEAVEMDEDEADYFLSSMGHAPKKDGQDRPDPKYFKMLKIERDTPKALAQPDALMVHATGQKAANVTELRSILSDLAKSLERPDEPEELKKLEKDNKLLKKENKQLRTRLEIIEERLGLVKTDGEQRGEQDGGEHAA